MAGKHLFTSESVAERHPDKCADQITDAVLDAIIAKDRDARVNCETLILQGTVPEARPAPANLPQDGLLRPLRQGGPRLRVGKDGRGRCLEEEVEQ